MFRAGDIVDGKYRIERVIAEGGVAVVVQAEQLGLDRHVAIKLLRPDVLAEAEVVEFFKREGSLAAKIKSEHVVRIHDVGESPAIGPYMVMELLDGIDLEHRLEGGPLSVEEAVEHVVQACDALSEAHHLRIVHRDIKPANLFLASRAPRPPILKIIDFGISKVVPRPGAPGLATLELTAGTPAYMSPEQVRGEEVDARADIWSLGVVLFELLTRELPFPFSDAQALLEQICTATPRRVRSLRPELPEALDEVITRCLARDRASRFGSATELADALQPFRAVDLLRTSGDISAVVRPVVPDASRQAPTVVVRPRTRLHRAAVMGAVAFTVLAAIGAGLIGVVLLRKHEATPAATVAAMPTASVASTGTENADPPPPPAVDSPPPVASSSTATPKATASKLRPRAPSKTHSSAPTGSDRSMFGERK